MDKIKIATVGFFAILSAWLGTLAIPLSVLCFVMALDYFTGVISALKHSKLNSQIGIFGIIKKVGYLLLVATAAVVDYLLALAVTQLNMDFKLPFIFALLVTIWLIVNELISILENLVKWDVPVPAFLTKIIDKLKNAIDKRGDITHE